MHLLGNVYKLLTSKSMLDEIHNQANISIDAKSPSKVQLTQETANISVNLLVVSKDLVTEKQKPIFE